MKAARLFAYNAAPRLVEVPEPKITGPLDVIVRIAGAGVCRTDLHLVEGVFDQVRDKLPFTLGHENAGWIEEVGPGVPDLAKQFPLEDVADVLHLLETGRIEGRAVLVPAAARSARACRSSIPGRRRPLTARHRARVLRSLTSEETTDMATNSVALRGTARREERGSTDWRAGWRVCVLACAGFIALFVGLGMYMHAFAWYAGIDAASPEFALYWRSLLFVELVGGGIATIGWWAWLVRSGRTIAQASTREEEVRRIAVFWGLVGATSVVLYFMASFFPNSDGAWHQTAVRDTAFTPTHIVMFYAAFPLGITMTIGTYLYGRTRLPNIYGVGHGFPWSFFFLIAASITEMMQVAMNEWGHSLWITEEFFAAPFHWPFVTYGWLASGIFALWAETLIRLLAIEAEADQQEQPAVATATTSAG